MNTSPVGSTSASKPTEASTSASSAATGSLDSASLLPEPPQTDVGFAIAEMVIQNAFNSRKAARQDRQQATERMVAAQEAQVAELRKQADQKFAAACLEAVGKMVEGGASVAGGAIAAVGANDTARDVGAAVKGAGQHDAGVLGLASTFFTHDADESAAKAKTAEMEATGQKEAVDNANDEVDEARQHIRTALDFLRQFKSTEAESMRSAIRA